MTPEALVGPASSGAARSPMTPEAAFEMAKAKQMPLEPGDEVTVVPPGFDGASKWRMPLPRWSDAQIKEMCDFKELEVPEGLSFRQCQAELQLW